MTSLPGPYGEETESCPCPGGAPAGQPSGKKSAQTGPVGVLEGEGVGPEVVRASLRVLAAVEEVTGKKFELRWGGLIGTEAESRCGQPLSEEVAGFCGDVFADDGVILSGPGGGRFVYDLRRRFDLYYKLSPLKPCSELAGTGRLRPEYVRDVDVLIVRDNAGGVYQGSWRRRVCTTNGRVAEHTFTYTERQVRRIVEVAARQAAGRRGRMSVVIKEGGVPAVTELWREVAAEVADQHGVGCAFINVDHAAYRLIQDAAEFDVLVTPNLCGDVLADLGAVLLGSRGLSFSGNFSPEGYAVYQTNHGAAYDLAGTGRANPAAQICSLAMLLRESFGLLDEARWVENAMSRVWRQGWRTDDLWEPGGHRCGTEELTDQVVQAVALVAREEGVACARHSC
jgi:3-isopropylmalate dehydrogenase